MPRPPNCKRCGKPKSKGHKCPPPKEYVPKKCKCGKRFNESGRCVSCDNWHKPCPTPTPVSPVQKDHIKPETRSLYSIAMAGKVCSVSYVDEEIMGMLGMTVDHYEVHCFNNPVAVEFGLCDNIHYEALAIPILKGEITLEELNDAGRNGPKLTALVASKPSNPHPGIVFRTWYDDDVNDPPGSSGKPINETCQVKEQVGREEPGEETKKMPRDRTIPDLKNASIEEVQKHLGMIVCETINTTQEKIDDLERCMGDAWLKKYGGLEPEPDE